MNQLEHYHARRQLLIELLGGLCAHKDCFEVDNLQFDHIDPNTKKFSLGSKMSYKWDVVLAEANKCQLLCSRHHREKNKKDNGEAKHGTYSMYRHYACRCRPCMDAYNVARKKWRK